MEVIIPEKVQEEATQISQSQKYSAYHNRFKLSLTWEQGVQETFCYKIHTQRRSLK